VLPARRCHTPKILTSGEIPHRAQPSRWRGAHEAFACLQLLLGASVPPLGPAVRRVWLPTDQAQGSSVDHGVVGGVDPTTRQFADGIDVPQHAAAPEPPEAEPPASLLAAPLVVEYQVAKQPQASRQCRRASAFLPTGPWASSRRLAACRQHLGLSATAVRRAVSRAQRDVAYHPQDKTMHAATRIHQPSGWPKPDRNGAAHGSGR